ncbi:MAG: protein kinase [bacterium]
MQLKNYQIGEKVSEDVIGKLYTAKRMDSEGSIYLKILHENFSTHDDIVQAFHQSAELYCSIENENYIRALGHGDELGMHYIILDHFDLLTLEEVLSKRIILSITNATEIIGKLATILRFDHIDGIIHGHLTPQNIFIDDHFQQVKLTDFGFGGFIRLLIKKKHAPILTLLPYYSPEFIEGVVNLDRRSDIFSLGVLFYRILLGEIPWFYRNFKDYSDQAHQRTVIPPSLQRLEVPDILDPLILETLESKIENRYPNLSIFLEHLSKAKSSILASQTPAISKQNGKFNPPTQKQDLSKSKMRRFSFWSFLKITLIPVILLFSVFILIVFTFHFNWTSRLIKHLNISILDRGQTWQDSDNKKVSRDLLENTEPKAFLAENNLKSDANSAKKKPFSKRDTSWLTLKDIRIKVPAKTKTRENLNSADSFFTNLTKGEFINKTPSKKAIKNQYKSQIAEAEKPALKVSQTHSPYSSVNLEISVRSGQVPQEAEVFVDGTSYGKTNGQGVIIISKLFLRRTYLIKVQKSGFEMWAKEIAFYRPGSKSINVELRSLPSINRINSTQSKSNLNMGTLTIILSNPQNLKNAFVYINGKLWEGTKNTTPLRIQLAEGSYYIEVKKQGFRSEPPARTIELAKKEVKTVYFYLLPL